LISDRECGETRPRFRNPRDRKAATSRRTPNGIALSMLAFGVFDILKAQLVGCISPPRAQYTTQQRTLRATLRLFSSAGFPHCFRANCLPGNDLRRSGSRATLVARLRVLSAEANSKLRSGRAPVAPSPPAKPHNQNAKDRPPRSNPYCLSLWERAGVRVHCAPPRSLYSMRRGGHLWSI
jgi:hypothetical protein